MPIDVYLDGDSVEGWRLMWIRTRTDRSIHGSPVTTAVTTPAPLCGHLHNTPEEARNCPVAKAKKHLMGQ